MARQVSGTSERTTRSVWVASTEGFTMNCRNLTTAWLVVALLAGTSRAGEVVVSVSPGNMQGWLIATN